MAKSKKVRRHVIDVDRDGSYCVTCMTDAPDPKGVCSGHYKQTQVAAAHEFGPTSGVCIWCGAASSDNGLCDRGGLVSSKTMSTEYGSYISSKAYTGPSCFESHPALPLGEWNVYGGSCSRPVQKDADVYVGLDRYTMSVTGKAYPWRKEGYEIVFPITDGSIPKQQQMDDWNQMIPWLAAQVRDGKKVHVGCIGGHGRTGMLLAALVTELGVSDDPIAYVREHYCKKAVESQTQVDFLVKNHGAKPAPPSKSGTPIGMKAKLQAEKDWSWGSGEKDKKSKKSSEGSPKKQRILGFGGSKSDEVKSYHPNLKPVGAPLCLLTNGSHLLGSDEVKTTMEGEA